MNIVASAMSETMDQVLLAADIIRNSDGILVTAGAGMSVDSGLPDFRGNKGLWKKYPGLGQENADYVSLASRGAFFTSPARAWGFWGHCMDLYRNAIPHKGYALLWEIIKTMPNGGFVFTSNVDGEFEKAGFSPETITECHGSMHFLQCLNTQCECIYASNSVRVPHINEALEWEGKVPTCSCGSVLRPNVLLFNDGPNWRSERYQAQERLLEAWMNTVDKLVVVEIGSGGAVPTVRLMGEGIAKKRNCSLIRINLDNARVQREMDVSIKDKAITGIAAIHGELVRKRDVCEMR